MEGINSFFYQLDKSDMMDYDKSSWPLWSMGYRRATKI